MIYGSYYEKYYIHKKEYNNNQRRVNSRVKNPLNSANQASNSGRSNYITPAMKQSSKTFYQSRTATKNGSTKETLPPINNQRLKINYLSRVNYKLIGKHEYKQNKNKNNNLKKTRVNASQKTSPVIPPIESKSKNKISKIEKKYQQLNSTKKEKSVLQQIFEKINQSIKSKLPDEILEIAEEIKKKRKFPSKDVLLSRFKRFIQTNSSTLKEKLQFIYDYVYFKKRYFLRGTQLMALIISVMNTSNIKKIKKLLQVNTGEGKTLIAQCVALYFVLFGRKVDIATSTEVLAKENYLDSFKFFEDLPIKIDFIDPQVQANGSTQETRKCYSADVLYGTCHQYCVDALNEYNLLKRIRVLDGGATPRKYDVIIIDEVDNMLIDNFNNMTIISEEMGDFLEIDTVKQMIWYELLRYLNQTSIAVFKEFLNGYFESICTTLRALLKEKIYQFMKHMHRSHSGREIIHKMWEKWVRSAVIAFFKYHRNQDYILVQKKCGQISLKLINVDTGMLQDGMRLQDGLHEFLEIKEGLRMGTGSFACFFKSCVRFFKSYDTIVGLSGTLGSENFLNFFKEIYETDCYIIPPFKKSMLIEENPKYESNCKNWLSSIHSDMKNKLILSRSVLIIFKTIKDLQLFNEYQKQKRTRANFIEYIYSDDTKISQKIKNINPRTVILSTNLGGRGTDFQLSRQLIINKGMHLILTFYTPNSRVTSQALGRVARKGEPGSATLIYNTETHQGLQKKSFHQNSDNTFLDKVEIISPQELSKNQTEAEKTMLQKIKYEIKYNYTTMEDFLLLFMNWIDRRWNDLKENNLLEAAKHIMLFKFSDLKMCIQMYTKMYENSKLSEEELKNKLETSKNNNFQSFKKDFSDLQNDLEKNMKNSRVILNYLVKEHFDKKKRDPEKKILSLLQNFQEIYPENVDAQLIYLELSGRMNQKNTLDTLIEKINKRIVKYENLFNDFDEINNEYIKCCKKMDLSSNILEKNKKVYIPLQFSSELEVVHNYFSKDKNRREFWKKGEFKYELFQKRSKLIMTVETLKICKKKNFDLQICDLFRQKPDILSLAIFPKFYKNTDLKSFHIVDSFNFLDSLILFKKGKENQINSNVSKHEILKEGTDIEILKEYYYTNNQILKSLDTVKNKSKLLQNYITTFCSNEKSNFIQFFNKSFVELIFKFYFHESYFIDASITCQMIKNKFLNATKIYKKLILNECFLKKHQVVDYFLDNYLLKKKIYESDFKNANESFQKRLVNYEKSMKLKPLEKLGKIQKLIFSQVVLDQKGTLSDFVDIDFVRFKPKLTPYKNHKLFQPSFEPLFEKLRELVNQLVKDSIKPYANLEKILKNHMPYFNHFLSKNLKSNFLNTPINQEKNYEEYKSIVLPKIKLLCEKINQFLKLIRKFKNDLDLEYIFTKEIKVHVALS